MKSHRTLARHILDAIHSIEKYTHQLAKEEFLSDFMIQDAVVRNLEIIGEACRNIPSNVKEAFPGIPWRTINSMRNKLVHEYFRVDAETVWNVVQFDLDDLKKHVNSLLSDEP
jgi:uncharacterized protein with HEPN domain